MKYVSMACFAVIAVNLCSPAWAGRGNALAGGWDSTLTNGKQNAAPAAAPTTTRTTASTSLFSAGIFAGSSFSLSSLGGGSGGNTGGAPSPEVNAALSLILVGGTVAFLRRRQFRNAEPQA